MKKIIQTLTIIIESYTEASSQIQYEEKKFAESVFISLFFLFNGCNNSKPTSQDFIGTWVSEDGGEIILRSDSTCVCVCV